MVTLSGKFVYEDNTAVANGILVLTLSQACNISGTAQIAPLVKSIQLDATGAIPGSTQVYGNDALTPSGTVYYATLYTGVLNAATGLYSPGAQLFSQQWSLTGSSVDVSTLAATVSGVSYVSPVTSVALQMPGEFAVSGSPVTSSGTFVVTKASQTANTVFAAPSGSAGAPTFRALVDADIPVTLANHTLTSPTVTNPSTTGTDSGAETLKNKTLQGVSSGNNVSLLNAQSDSGQLTGTGAAQVFFTYTLPANAVSTGKGIRVSAAWNHSVGTASVSYSLSLNGTAVHNFVGSNSNSCSVIDTIMASSNTTADINGIYALGATGPAMGSAAFIVTSGLSWSSNQVLQITFNVANTDKIIPISFIVELIQ